MNPLDYELPGFDGASIVFRPDMLVIHDLDDWSTVPPEHISHFADDVWYLYPAARKVTARTAVTFSNSPTTFVDALKRIVWCMMNLVPVLEVLERPQGSIHTRLSPSSVRSIYKDLVSFRRELERRDIMQLCDVSPEVLQDYAEMVAGLPVSWGAKYAKLWAITRIWLHAPHLPVSDRIGMPPWEAAGSEDLIHDLLGRPPAPGENLTEPIHPATMSPTLVWCLRYVEEFAEDIIQAKELRDSLLAQFREHSRPGDRERWNQYVDELRRRGGALPGRLTRRGREQVAVQYLAATLDVARETIVNSSRHRGIPIQIGAPLDIEIGGRIDGTPWTSSIDFYEVDQWVRRLAAASFAVIGYLSGMRVEECRALARGCCQRSSPDDPLSGFEIRALTFKVTGPDGNAVRGGQERPHPWYVIEPVATAISVMERLHPYDLLFPVAAFNSRTIPHSETRAATTHTINRAIRQLVDWCNDSASRLGRAWEHVPEDPAGAISINKFRRTLAWFIYRRPAGRISLGIQYGHVTLNTTDSYGSRARTGIGNVFQFEEAAAIRDHLEAAAEQFADGGGVSGPAADRYIAGVTEYSQQYAGRYLTRREMIAMSANPNLRIYDNDQQFVACCYDSSQALCHPDRGLEPGIDQSPDLTACRPECANIARTDEHIAALELEVHRLEDERNLPQTPKPWRVRLGQRIRRLRRIITDHLRRRSAGDTAE